MAYSILVSAQGPLVLGFWVLGLRVWVNSLGALEVLGTFRISVGPLGAKLAFFILKLL